jgi:DNA-binding CsgD family transcriptional regulator
VNRRAFLAGTSATLALLTVGAPAVLAADLAVRTRGPWYSPLTPREAQIAVLVTAGLTTRQIASRLGMTPWTTDQRVVMILQKIDVGRRAQIRDWVIKQQQKR